MFSRKDQLLRKTGPDGIGRFDYLRLLKKEFNETNSEGIFVGYVCYVMLVLKVVDR